jgi:hypothetical protein
VCKDAGFEDRGFHSRVLKLLGESWASFVERLFANAALVLAVEPPDRVAHQLRVPLAQLGPIVEAKSATTLERAFHTARTDAGPALSAWLAAGRKGVARLAPAEVRAVAGRLAPFAANADPPVLASASAKLPTRLTEDFILNSLSQDDRHLHFHVFCCQIDDEPSVECLSPWIRAVGRCWEFFPEMRGRDVQRLLKDTAAAFDAGGKKLPRGGGPRKALETVLALTIDLEGRSPATDPRVLPLAEAILERIDDIEPRLRPIFRAEALSFRNKALNDNDWSGVHAALMKADPRISPHGVAMTLVNLSSRCYDTDEYEEGLDYVVRARRLLKGRTSSALLFYKAAILEATHRFLLGQPNEAWLGPLDEAIGGLCLHDHRQLRFALVARCNYAADAGLATSLIQFPLDQLPKGTRSTAALFMVDALIDAGRYAHATEQLRVARLEAERFSHERMLLSADLEEVRILAATGAPTAALEVVLDAAERRAEGLGASRVLADLEAARTLLARAGGEGLAAEWQPALPHRP